jgi:lipid-A-disaccharide synthase-like uncharacterized protein
MTLIAPVAQSLGCRALEDGLLYIFFLVTLAGFMTACLFGMTWVLHFFADRDSGSQKQTTFSKGANR